MKNKKNIKAKENINPQKRILIFSLLIVLSVIILYLPALKNNILNWDDDLYVTSNTIIKNLGNIPSFFNMFFIGNYHPLTLITYCFIYHFSETSPFIYHFINILFHLLNSLLVFYFFKELFKNINLAFLVSLLFGLHPLHVESVAWISELKDVQFAFFFFISLIFYLKFIRQKNNFLYIISVFFFLFSLLSKGQAVALCPVLLLVDYFERGKLFTKLLEKIPFFILSVVFGIIAIIAQKSANTLADYSTMPFFEQMAFASYSFTMYILKTVIPFNLSAFYPYPVMIGGQIPIEYWAYLLVIPLVIFILIFIYKKNKIYFFGFTFFIVNIFLLLQIIPVGNCIMADRYTYIPSIGLNIIIAYLFFKYFERKKLKFLLTIFLSVYLIFLCTSTNKQIKKWKNDFTLWDNALSFNPDIPSALLLRGCAFNDMGDYAKALADFNKSICINPNDGLVYLNRGVSKSKLSNFKDAIKDFEIADKIGIEDRHMINLYVSWGGALANTGNLNEAMKLFDKVIILDSENASAYNNRGITKAMLNDVNGALSDFNVALKLNPNYSDAYSNKTKILELLSKK